VTILDRVPTEQINARAREVDLGGVLLTLLALPFFLLGFAAAGLWTAVGWCWAAVQVGWEQGRVSARQESPPGSRPG
jgi:hypothetical protein